MDTQLINELRQLSDGVCVLTDPADCWAYGSDYSRIHHCPAAVVFPETHEEVVSIVRLCHEYATPLTVRGGGTSVTGSAVPTQGGLVMSMEHLRQVLDFDAHSRFVTVQTGATNQSVQSYCMKKDLFWPPDPGSAVTSTVGGNLACNAAGPRAVKYGATRENVLGLKAVSGRGDELICGSATTKNSMGFDLTRLLVGSEGTLAVITEATLKLSPVPLRTHTMQADYDSIEHAAAAVIALMSQPATPCALELMDDVCVRLVNDYLKKESDNDKCVRLLIQADGTEVGADADAEAIRVAATNAGCLQFRLAQDENETVTLWEARRALSPALRQVAPSHLGEDFVVPLSNLSHFVKDVRACGEQHGVLIASFGHAGNGNLHVNLMYDPQNEEETRAVYACLDDLIDITLKHGGSLSGEHGIGLHKRHFVSRQIPEGTLNLMREVKRVFDPKGILNADKQLPPDPATGQ